MEYPRSSRHNLPLLFCYMARSGHATISKFLYITHPLPLPSRLPCSNFRAISTSPFSLSFPLWPLWVAISVVCPVVPEISITLHSPGLGNISVTFSLTTPLTLSLSQAIAVTLKKYKHRQSISQQQPMLPQSLISKWKTMVALEGEERIRNEIVKLGMWD